MPCADFTTSMPDRATTLHGFDLLDPSHLAAVRDISRNGFRDIAAGVERGTVHCATCDHPLQPGHGPRMARVYAMMDVGVAADGRVLDAIVLACQACFDRYGGLPATLTMLGERVIAEIRINATAQPEIAHEAKLAGGVSASFRWVANRMDVEWQPGLPKKFTPRLKRRYLAARAAFMQKVADRTGQVVAIADATGMHAFTPAKGGAA